MIRIASLALAVLASSSALAQEPLHHKMSLLMHNGSMMLATVQGHEIRIDYEQPRPGLREAGVYSGTTLITGTLSSDGSIEATSRLFRAGCPTVEFPVWGRIAGDRIGMTGTEPRWSKKDRCRPDFDVGKTDLVFTGRPSEIAALVYQPNEEETPTWVQQGERIVGSATIPAEPPVVAVVPPAPAPVVAAPAAQAAASSPVAVVVNVSPALAPAPAPEPMAVPASSLSEAVPVEAPAPAPAKPKLDIDF